MHALLTASSGMLAVAIATAASNPIQVASSKYLGLRNSTNSQGLRDLGFMGNIGNTWIMSFGDGVGTKNINTFNSSAPVCSPTGICAYISARDGGGIPADNDPLHYADTNTILNAGCCGNIPEMDYFCPHLSNEDTNQGLGITNVVQVNSTTGVIYTRPTVNGTSLDSNGAGLALVTLGSNGAVPKCTRPFGRSTWTPQEPDWGQLSAINDGTYTYAYAYDGGNETRNVLITRAPTAGVFDINNYRYWNGNKWDSSRVYIPYLSNSSPYNLVGLNNAGQGSVFYSKYYKQYVYISTGNGVDDHNVYAWTATVPQGPWTAPVRIWNDNGIAPDAFEMYGPFIAPKYFSSDGKTIVFAYTKGGIYNFVIQLTFQ